MSEFARGPLRKIEGKTYPVIGEVVVRLTANMEMYDVDGHRFVKPHREERLEITFERDGKAVALGKVALNDVLRQIEDPNCAAALDADPEEQAFQRELRGEASP